MSDTNTPPALLPSLIRALDPAVDENWTVEGLPDLYSLQQGLGRYPTRAEVAAAIPGYTRDVAAADAQLAIVEQPAPAADKPKGGRKSKAKAGAPAPAPEAPAATAPQLPDVASPPAPPEPEDAPAPAPARPRVTLEQAQERRQELEGRSIHLARQIADLTREKDKIDAEHAKLVHALDRYEDPEQKQRDNIQQYLESEKRTRHERAERVKAATQGVNLKDVVAALRTGSKIDHALKNRPRPVPR